MRKNAEANANLIAAAPDLYAALDDARQFVNMCRHDADPEYQQEAEATLGVIDAALSRARGEENG